MAGVWRRSPGLVVLVAMIVSTRQRSCLLGAAGPQPNQFGLAWNQSATHEKARSPGKMTRKVINQKTSALVFENHTVFYNIPVY